MSPVRAYHRYRGLRDFTMGSLLEAAHALLPRIVPRQTRYKVTDLPTERTIRYYMSRGLVDRPAGRKGTSALFSYRHLLQVLAVKNLQSQYLPLRRIRSLLRDKTNRELERLLGETGADTSPVKVIPETTGRRLSPPRGGEGWRRHVLAPGIELHLREDLPGPEGREGRARIEERLLSVLAKIWAEQN